MHPIGHGAAGQPPSLPVGFAEPGNSNRYLSASGSACRHALSITQSSCEDGREPFNRRRTSLVPARVGVSINPGEMLRTIRELQELSQTDLAALTGIAQSNLSALETGSRELGRERALVLAKALRVHPAVLLFPDFDVSDVA